MPQEDADRGLIAATKPFAKESPGRSSWALVSTLIPLVATLGAALAPFGGLPPAVGIVLRASASVVAALLVVRMFILFHDFWHGAIFRRSRLARAFFWTYGILVMTPARVWRDTHNYHHAHTAKLVGSNVGSYIMVSTSMWAKMTPKERRMYRAVRHPLTIACGYFTIFMLGMCVSPLLRAPKKNWTAGLALACNLALSALVLLKLGPLSFVFGMFLPLALAMAIGAYLFYAQHNFPDMVVQRRESWDFARAALESSSYMEMGGLMSWFTGNIGFHHVHHLNPLIPFYRLPQTMRAVPALQNAKKTSLRLGDIRACFGQKLWDAETGHMVGYP